MVVLLVFFVVVIVAVICIVVVVVLVFLVVYFIIVANKNLTVKLGQHWVNKRYCCCHCFSFVVGVVVDPDNLL